MKISIEFTEAELKELIKTMRDACRESKLNDQVWNKLILAIGELAQGGR